MNLVILVAQLVLLVHSVQGFIAPTRSPEVKLVAFPTGENSSQPGQAQLATSSTFNMAASDTAVVWGSELELKSENACFGGRLLRFVHQSWATKTSMTFTVFLPPKASTDAPVPVITSLQRARIQYDGP